MIDSTNEGICQRDQLSEAALKDVEYETLVVNSDNAELGENNYGVEIPQAQRAIASDNSSQELDLMPRVIVTSRIEGAIATSSVLQEQVSKPQMPKDISSPIPPPVKPQPIGVKPG